MNSTFTIQPDSPNPILPQVDPRQRWKAVKAPRFPVHRTATKKVIRPNLTKVETAIERPRNPEKRLVDPKKAVENEVCLSFREAARI